MSALARAASAAALAAALLWSGGAAAEPYLAAREGMKCAVCHVNPTGGGMRTAFGNVYAQTRLAAERINPNEPWTGQVAKYLAVGGDFRGVASYTDIPHQDAQSEFEVGELRLYAAAELIQNRLLLYVDERVAPGGATNMEAYARLWFGENRWYLKAGQMYLPFGLRLEDDAAFIRATPGINMTTPDTGVELGLEQGPWSAQLAIGNGRAGAPETDEGKQASLRVEHVASTWRAGASFNLNHTDDGDRTMYGAFAGLRTGAVTWLAEADLITDETFPGGERDLQAALIEANWTWHQGQNLKATAEYLEPDGDVDEDEQNRYSVVWEYTPFEFLQSRLGIRQFDGIPQNDIQNRRVLFWELHAFF